MTSYQGNIVIKNPATPTGPFENGTAPGIWKLNEVLAFKRQGIWPTQGIQGPDPYFEYVSLLLSTTSLSNANNNLFVDSSGAFNPISRNGNPTQGSAIPYGTNWSNYFNGSDANLTFPSSSQFAIATSTTPFTIEAWIYPTAAGSCIFSEQWTGSVNIPIVISMSNGSIVDAINGQYIAFGYYTGSSWVTAAVANTQVSLNVWTHIACVFTGSTTKIYYNGVDVTKTSSPTPATTWGVTGASGDSWYVGRRWDGAGNNFFSGYISNLRFVNGTAVYTSAFTPPTAPLTAITNTVLLTCQSNRFRDTSANNFTTTVAGTPRVTDFSPFNPTYPGMSYNQSDITNWSGYFDGSGDYLDVPNSTAFDQNTAFTVEMWVYPTGADITDLYFYSQNTTNYFCLALNSSGQIAIDKSGVAFVVTSSAAITVGAWTHIAMVSNGSTISLYVNGVSQGSAAVGTTAVSTTTVRIGAWQGTGGLAFPGYISNLRVVKGTAVYTTNFTPPTTNLTAISGTSLLTLQNAAFTDNSTNNFVITPNGNVTVTGNSPFNTVGYWSNYFDGTNRLSVASNAAFGMGTGDFTVECWINLSAPQSAATKHITDSGTANFMFLKTNTTQIGIGRAQIAEDTMFNYTFNVGTWYHVAFTRSGSTVRGFVNGVQIGSATNSINYATGALTIGNDSNGTQPLGGYLSNLRIVKGTALYTSNFTPPTAPLTVVSNTSILTCQNGRFIDNSTNAFTITVTGSPSVQSFDPFYTATTTSSGGSMYFDGSDYINAPTSPLFGLGTSNYTIEMWVFPTANPGNGPGTIFDLRTGPTATATVARINSSLQLLVYNGPANVEFVAGTVPLNAWTHIALVRSSGSLVTYINGAVSNTTTLSSDLGSSQPCFIGVNQSAGYNFNGYISDFRITKGTAVYTSAFTPPSAPLTPTAATTLLVNGMNAGIFDATAINDMETVGNAQVSTAVSKFGGSSVYFDGTGDYLTSNAASDLYAFGTGDFTVEMWFNLSSFANLQVLYDSRPTSTDGLYVCIFVPAGGASVNLQVSAATQITGTATLSTGVWYHLALSRSSGSTKMFLNGTQVGSTYADTNAYLNSGTTRPFVGGSSYSAGTLTVNGYIDELRVTKGIARYTANFTPPTQPFPVY